MTLKKSKKLPKQYDFLFDLGNSSNGPIGFCAVMRGKNSKDALKKMKKAIEWFGQQIDAKKATGLAGEMPEVEYLRVYFNPDYISHLDIVDVTPVE